MQARTGMGMFFEKNLIMQTALTDAGLQDIFPSLLKLTFKCQQNDFAEWKNQKWLGKVNDLLGITRNHTSHMPNKKIAGVYMEVLLRHLRLKTYQKLAAGDPEDYGINKKVFAAMNQFIQENMFVFSEFGITISLNTEKELRANTFNQKSSPEKFPRQSQVALIKNPVYAANNNTNDSYPHHKEQTLHSTVVSRV